MKIIFFELGQLNLAMYTFRFESITDHFV